MPESIYVVHSHMHDSHGNGGGGFQWWPEAQEQEAREAYATESGVDEETYRLLDVTIYKVERPEGLDDEALDVWVFDNFEAGQPPVEPLEHFLKGDYDA